MISFYFSGRHLLLQIQETLYWTLDTSDADSSTMMEKLMIARKYHSLLVEW